MFRRLTLILAIVLASSPAIAQTTTPSGPVVVYPSISPITAPVFTGQWTVNGSLCAAGQVVQGGSPTICTATPTVTSLTLSGGSTFIADVTSGAGPANTAALRNGTTEQQFFLYNTYTSATSFERVRFRWDSNAFDFLTEKGSGGGTARAMSIGTKDSQSLIMVTNNVNRWVVYSNGFLEPQVGNTYDLGEPGFAPRSYYADTSYLGPLFGGVASTSLTFPADGQLNVTNNGVSAGVGFDVATDAVFKVRVRAQNAYATADALAYRASGTPITSGTTHLSAGSGMAVANVGANSCGTTTATIAGNNNSGEVTVGATSGSQCRIAFTVTAANKWQCVANDETTAVLTRGVPVDTTHADLVGVFTAGDVIVYHCWPR